MGVKGAYLIIYSLVFLWGITNRWSPRGYIVPCGVYLFLTPIIYIVWVVLGTYVSVWAHILIHGGA